MILLQNELNQEVTRRKFLQEVKKLIPANPTCAELGVFEGGFSHKILELLKPSTLYLIDPWEVGSDKNGATATYGSWDGDPNALFTAYSTESEQQKVKDQFANEISSGQVKLAKGFSYEVVSQFKDSLFDLIYIDACHLYDCVKADLIQYLPKMKSLSIIAGHDYTEHFPGVMKAVDEFCKNQDFEMIILNPDGGDWAIKRKN